MKRALVVGSRGQDGRLLLERLRADGCEAAGVGREDGDVGDPAAVSAWIREHAPDEIYYLAAVHHSAEDRRALGGRELYEASHRVHVTGLLNVLEAVRAMRPDARVVYAASSLVFGEPASNPQDESTPMAPVCVYGITKATGAHCCRFYRKSAAVHASVAILYSHESPLRKADFLSQKIVRAAVAIRRGAATKLVIGDLGAVNDWGWAGDTVDALMRIARHDEPDDFVVATGTSRTAQDFVRAVFDRAGLDWTRHVEEDKSMIARRRPPLIGDARRLRERTGWAPTVSFEEMAGRLWDAAWTSTP